MRANPSSEYYRSYLPCWRRRLHLRPPALPTTSINFPGSCANRNTGCVPVAPNANTAQREGHAMRDSGEYHLCATAHQARFHPAILTKTHLVLHLRAGAGDDVAPLSIFLDAVLSPIIGLTTHIDHPINPWCGCDAAQQRVRRTSATTHLSLSIHKFPLA